MTGVIDLMMSMPASWRAYVLQKQKCGSDLSPETERCSPDHNLDLKKNHGIQFKQRRCNACSMK
ncbi:hypothetical protein MUK42_14258 [Musa troglodytarum]|uniref:Uncharacterized protein n=1 Tax=Musa troglodytarum TaxID=320322 RepID=A0A9E7I6U4_9LILI|nr:hypothetical protein MUK42_14258 [Musa troglodytarum]